MLDLSQLDDLVGDSMVLAARHILTEVFPRLERRGIEFHEILTSIADICGDRGYTDALKKIEEIATDIKFSPIPKEKQR